MTDTITLREACPHQLYDSHCTGGYEWHQEQRDCNSKDKGDLVCEWCPGGKERTFRQEWHADLRSDWSMVESAVLVEVTQ